MPAKQHAPIEAKVANFTLSSSGVAAIAFYLCNYVFHMPAAKASAISAAVPILVGFIVAYRTHHTPRLDEVAQEVAAALASMAQPVTTGGASQTVSLPAIPAQAPVTQPAISAADLGGGGGGHEEPASPREPDPYQHLVDGQP